ncbi:hypothetical protein BDV93DRAFT_505925 [Ceratobasidium sp. AG-I]|nr:hypothetical protein BDV93DRAFT_505925 [Ceratobasidium sp. AG-I]
MDFNRFPDVCAVQVENPAQAEPNLLASTREHLGFLRTLHKPPEHLSRAESVLKVNWECSQTLLKLAECTEKPEALTSACEQIRFCLRRPIQWLGGGSMMFGQELSIPSGTINAYSSVINQAFTRGLTLSGVPHTIVWASHADSAVGMDGVPGLRHATSRTGETTQMFASGDAAGEAVVPLE